VLNQSARVALPGAWYPVPFFWHMNGVALGAAIIACKRRVEINFPRFSGHAKPSEVSGSNTVSDANAR
jgi:hypothetical protein